MSARAPLSGGSDLASGRSRLTVGALASLIFFTASGGPFGLEPLIGAVGPGLALALLLATPLLWSIPIALMAAELTAMMPEEGGFYVWVTRALGPFWGVQEAWWSMAYSLVLLASFPVLFVGYLANFVPSLVADGSGVARWGATVLVTLTATAVNLLGAKFVGRTAAVAAVAVIGAFAALTVCWFVAPHGPAGTARALAGGLNGAQRGAMLLGLSIVVFNYSGWDNASTYAGEVEHPQRTYPRALALALSAVVLSYVLPVLAGISVTTDAATWSVEAGWPAIAGLIGGPVLGHAVAAAGLVSVWALFGAQLLYVTRLPFAMARDGWLPAAFARVSDATGAPTTAIVTFCVLTALLATVSFNGLAVIVCLLNVMALALEFLALLVLRRRLPDAARPFRVPGGRAGLVAITLLPLSFAVAVVGSTLSDWRSFPAALCIVAAVMLTGVGLYFLRRRQARPEFP
jgi:amino acid transporter